MADYSQIALGNPLSSSPLSTLPSVFRSNATQPFCNDAEGWGPISPNRFDFTPCFLEVLVAPVAAFGLVLGAGAIWLLMKSNPQPVKNNWHFYTKLAVLCGVIIATVLQAVFEAIWGGGVDDVRFWSSILMLAALAVIFVVQYIEHGRSRQPNGIVLFFWLLLIVAYGIKLQSLVARKVYNYHLAYFAAFNVALGLSVSEFILEYLVPKVQNDYHVVGNECPYEYADIFSVLTFSWLNPMMKYGNKNFLTQDDLWDLPPSDTTRVTGNELGAGWEEQLKKDKPSLWLAVFNTFKGPYLWGILLKCLSDVFAFTQPQLLRLLIDFIESYQTDSPYLPGRGVSIALAMFAVAVIQSLLLHQHYQLSYDTGMRIKSALTAVIYNKALKLSSEGRATKTTGDIVNHMAVDQQRVADLASSGAQLISGPFQIIICLASLYQLVGWTMFAGVGVMILMIPLNSYITRSMKRLQVKQMKNKDARTRLMTGILNNMKSIKLYAWNPAFMTKLNHVRNDLELANLKKFGMTQSVANFAWNLAPFLVSCSTFAIFALTSDTPLNTDIVFPAMTLFNLLAFPLAILPMVITAAVEASVAVKRLTDYLTAEELQSDAVTVEKTVTHHGGESLQVSEGFFTWDRYKDTDSYVLKNISFSAKKGELSCIVGRVGSGKSSLLQAMLGDLWKSHGQVIVRGQMAYVAQTPWLMNTSVRENIVFGHKWDADFYKLTLDACALSDDMDNLPDGDRTEIGERGISLSGGQKARVTLARAVYARADIYLLDDILSAVDQHVGAHLIKNVLGRHGILHTKTRILATNTLTVLKDADFIAMVGNRTLLEQGTYHQLSDKKGGEVAKLLHTGAQDTSDQGSANDDASSSSGSATKVEDEDDDSAVSEEEERIEHVDTNTPIRKDAARRQSTATLRRASTATYKGPSRKPGDEESGKMKTSKTKETSSQGKVKWSVYMEYAKESNLLWVGLYFVSLLAVQTGQIGSGFWLKQWSEDSGNPNSPGPWTFIGIYFALGMASAILVIVQNILLWIFCAIEASRKLHQSMAQSIFRAPMSFFETTPSGRILNRFSTDVYRIDEVIARSFNTLFNNLGRLLFTTIVISISTPAFLILVLPLGWLYHIYQRYYLRTSRELKRLDSVTKSPIFAHFQESINGVSTIRAYGQQNRFALENEWFMDGNLQAYFPSISANRWLAIRLEFIGSLIVFASAGLSIVSVVTVDNSTLSAGMVGLAMSYALQITQYLNSLVRQTVEVETNIISVERVLEYTNLSSEAEEYADKRPDSDWPPKGAISFKNYSMRYRDGLPLTLKNIDIEIKPHEKIGVVGRTGAGKSSLTIGLFRIVEPASGTISIDGLDVTTIGLNDLRGSLAIIPQDPALFEGTLRDNLDPDREHSDEEIWRELDHARLKELISGMDGQLDTRIQEGGSNLSQGQRQLVSLTRALLSPSKVLVLDEATAAVDVETDAILQRTLRSDIFEDRTMITIAHRINTIIDCDRILVLDKGEVVEFDSPTELLRQRGEFYELAKESGLLAEDGTVRK